MRKSKSERKIAWEIVNEWEISNNLSLCSTGPDKDKGVVRFHYDFIKISLNDFKQKEDISGLKLASKILL